MCIMQDATQNNQPGLGISADFSAPLLRALTQISNAYLMMASNASDGDGLWVTLRNTMRGVIIENPFALKEVADIL